MSLNPPYSLVERQSDLDDVVRILHDVKECCLDLTQFWASPGLRNLILHGADYDLRMMFHGYGFVPDKVFDTMIAAKFLGEERIGLTHLVEKRFGHVLSKANLTTHTKVVEKVMESRTILPMRFCTVAETADEIIAFLENKSRRCCFFPIEK